MGPVHEIIVLHIKWIIYDASESAHSHSLVSVTAIRIDRAKMLILMLQRSAWYTQNFTMCMPHALETHEQAKTVF